MDNPKKHKRSGSYSGKASASPLPHRRKKSLSGRYGRFQSAVTPKPEKKNLDVNVFSTVTTCPSLATATCLLLNSYTAGTGGTNTIGRRVLNRSILLRMMIAQPTVTGVTTVGPTGVRVIVVYDKETNGTVPTPSDIFQATAANSSALMNLNNAERFTVLIDEKFSFGQIVITAAPASAVSAPTTYLIDRYVKMRLDSVANSTFNGTTSNIYTGGIYLLAFSDTAAASNPPQVISGFSRIRFQDA